MRDKYSKNKNQGVVGELDISWNIIIKRKNIQEN